LKSCLLTGGNRAPLLPSLLEAIYRADEIEFAVAFIKSSGLDLVFQALMDAVELRKVQLTLLTSDYLDVTDPQALRQLMLLAERGADIRVFQTGSTTSFHLKAYIVIRREGEQILEGRAFIGSSNISRTALTEGIEWNYAVGLQIGADSSQIEHFKQIRREYSDLISHEQVMPLDYDWIDRYERRRKVQRLPVAPGSDDPELLPPDPNEVQVDALRALSDSRRAGFRRGLVVLATGLGKTYLAAFDSEKLSARRLLFVAHREEILGQAEATFQRIHQKARVGRYTGKRKEINADFLFASIQTLGQSHHLERFSTDHFDYVVVDEFHHAAAPTYRKLLSHFNPKFMLGLTATPERTDQSDILTLCDDNLVFTRNLIHGIESGLLAPFHYFGIYDESVDYQEIPWRNGQFVIDSLSNKLATLARARHSLREWREKAQTKTLAFCVSIKHAEFMAERFRREGVAAVAVHGESVLDRGEALKQLSNGEIEVIFSVDLFNEGVDLPEIDTVMMLRPTESKVLFLQQLGRGLRRHEKKEQLVVLDFIGNHQGFLNKPQALFGVGSTHKALAEFGRNLKKGRLALPPGCYVNYDLKIIEFLAHLSGDGSGKAYQTLRDSLGRRPTLSEFYRSGESLQKVRQQYGRWWRLVQDQGDLGHMEMAVLETTSDFLRELEITPMTKSFKAVLLEAFLEMDGLRASPTIDALAMQALKVFRRRPGFVADIRDDLQDLEHVSSKAWINYWKGNPINAWIGGNKKGDAQQWFEIENGVFQPTFTVNENQVDVLGSMIQEIVDYRLAAYVPRLPAADHGNVVPLSKSGSGGTELPFFPNLRIACGHFREGSAEVDEYQRIGDGYGRLDPARHFIARAIGDSMNGGKKPVNDGDYLLLERLGSDHAGSITGSTLVIERQDVTGDDQYLLRVVTKTPAGRYILKATNPEYPDYEANEEMRTLARLVTVLNPLEMAIDQEFKREEIPALFGETFSPGNWHNGHVVLTDKNAHILLVTINKQGKSTEHRYHDYFIDATHFHWQSQNSTTPESKRGKELINHERLGIDVHLFVREHKLASGKAAPFRYIGQVHYQSHEGSAPMSVIWNFDLGE